MPVTQLVDVIEPEAFSAYTEVNFMTQTALVQAGVAVPNTIMQTAISQGGDTLNVPFWNDLTSPLEGGADPYYSDDNPSHISTPSKVTASNQVTRKAYANNSWSAASFASELAGSDAMNRIGDRVTAYWEKVLQHRLVKSMYGIALDSVANHASDLVVDISGASAGAPVAINGESFTIPSISRDAVIQAAYSLGDAVGSFRAIAVHSTVKKRMSLNNEIATMRDADNDLTFDTYAGLLLITDDSLALAGDTYLSCLFGRGAVGYAIGEPATGYGTELYRFPAQGMGGGVTELYSRKNMIVHPAGYSFLSATVAGTSPSSTELATANNWTRVVPRKNVPLAFVVSK